MHLRKEGRKWSPASDSGWHTTILYPNTWQVWIYIKVYQGLLQDFSWWLAGMKKLSELQVQKMRLCYSKGKHDIFTKSYYQMRKIFLMFYSLEQASWWLYRSSMSSLFLRTNTATSFVFTYKFDLFWNA